MKIGNVSQTVWKRSIQKQLQHRREEVIIQPEMEEMCAAYKVADAHVTISASAVLYGDEKELGIYAIAKVCNNLASRGAETVGIDVNIQLPSFAYESRLKSMVGYIEACCAEQNLEVLGVKAEINPVIHSTLIYVTGMGSVAEQNMVQIKYAKPEQDIVQVGGVGVEGALRILNVKQEELEKRFIPSFFQKFLEYKNRLFIGNAMKIAISKGATGIQQLDEGGMLATLWEVGEAAHLGMEIQLKEMIIPQEVIEICEFTSVNPYQLSAIGSALIVIESGEKLVETYREMGIPAVVIGKTTKSNERVIFNGGEKRYLDRPTPGEFGKFYEEQRGNV